MKIIALLALALALTSIADAQYPPSPLKAFYNRSPSGLDFIYVIDANGNFVMRCANVRVWITSPESLGKGFVGCIIADGYTRTGVFTTLYPVLYGK